MKRQHRPATAENGRRHAESIRWIRRRLDAGETPGVDFTWGVYGRRALVLWLPGDPAWNLETHYAEEARNGAYDNYGRGYETDAPQQTSPAADGDAADTGMTADAVAGDESHR